MFSNSNNRIIRRNNSGDSNVTDSSITDIHTATSGGSSGGHGNVIMRHTPTGTTTTTTTSATTINTNKNGMNNNNGMGSSSINANKKQSRQRLNYPHNQTSRRSLTYWIGSALFCFMVSYIIFVFMFAVRNVSNKLLTTTNTNNIKELGQEDTNNSYNNNDNNINNNNNIRSNLQKMDNEKDEQEEQNLVVENNTKNESIIVVENNTSSSHHKRKKKYNKFHKHDLSLGLTNGVKPDVLIPHDSSIELPIAIKEDNDPDSHPTPNNILTAYIEASNFDEWDIKPLPIRRMAKEHLLTSKTYPRLNSCTKLIQQFPVDDTPVDYDTYLPWIHDVFPTSDGKFIQFVAQNKRRCKNGSFEKDILHQMQPQASLFQHVSVKRIINTKANNSKNRLLYKLVPHEDADNDGMATRFICRFKPSMEETLSVYNFLYDWTAFRKRYKASFLEDDAGIKAIHSSQLIFKCPVPDHLQEMIRNGSTVINDWATLFIDIIPIRTPPRWGSPTQYFPPWYKDFQNIPGNKNNDTVFDPIKEWGTDHILPSIIDSGRWENIPICKPSLMTYENDTYEQSMLFNDTTKEVIPKQKHKLVSCIWASAGYTTRGNRFAINDGQRRLLEWILYNKVIGFDHFYVYDNSGAFGSDTSLKPITDLFLDSNDVTYIPWPAQICNNNPNNVDSVGERSSQYAAEQSCRLRFGPHVDWIGQFDIDEYLVPMGEHKNILQLLNKLDKEDTRIVSFSSWRAWPRRAFINEPEPTDDPKVCWHNERCFELSIPTNYTMLQAYNCDRAKPGQKTEAMPAEKQVYKASYVVSHFVHYSIATTLSEKNLSEYEKEGFKWKPRPFPDARQRFANEVSEALMIHTKAVARQDTAGYERMCHINNTYLPIRRQGLCRLGVPWPETPYVPGTINATEEGNAYNCYVNRQVEDYLVPKLVKELKKHENFVHTSFTDKAMKL